MIDKGLRRIAIVGVVFVLLLSLSACSGGETESTSTAAVGRDLSSLVIEGNRAPVGTAHVATLSWDEAEAVLGVIPPEMADMVEGLDIREASFSVFVGGESELLDLSSDGRLRVSGALRFTDGEAARAALEALQTIATAYVESNGAEPEPLAADVAGAVAVSVAGSSFPGDAAAVAWAEGDVVRITFAQGGDPEGAALDLVNVMTGGTG